MQKDTINLREDESTEERKRIAELESEKELTVQKQMAEKIRKTATEQKKQLAVKTREEQEKERQAEQEKKEKEAAEQQKRAQENIREEQKRLQEQVRESTITPTPRFSIQKPSSVSQKAPPEEPIEHPPSPSSRVLARLVVVILVAFVLFNAILFGYWQLQQRGFGGIQLPPIPFLPGSDPIPPSPPSPQIPPPPVIPPPEPTSLGEQLQLPKTITIQFAGKQELLSSFSNILSQGDEIGLSHLNLQEGTDGIPITGVRFFALLEISIPQGITDQFQGDTVFFRSVYICESCEVVKVVSRWGFVTEITDAEQIQSLLQEWEPNVEFDILPIAQLFGSKGSAYTTQFRTKSPNDVTIRFQTFSRQDTGVVYALVDEKFLIFANSYEGAQTMIDQIRSAL
ncbi:hypothetical protein IID24_02495 [Patescibacteria group bacterium]|nr:hypothetical protein [Patescibacteria group bacterium]